MFYFVSEYRSGGTVKKYWFSDERKALILFNRLRGIAQTAVFCRYVGTEVEVLRTF